jgi:uncharacterized protein
MDRENGIYAACTVLLAFVLWFIIFFVTVGNFWFKLAFSASLLASISLALMSPARNQEFSVTPRHIAVGVTSAVFLYFVFMFGGWLLQQIIPFARAEIFSVYNYGGGASLHLVAFLLLFVTGPAEEIYWRGFLQKQLVRRFSPVAGMLLATTAYAFVHIWYGKKSIWVFIFPNQRNRKRKN